MLCLESTEAVLPIWGLQLLMLLLPLRALWYFSFFSLSFLTLLSARMWQTQRLFKRKQLHFFGFFAPCQPPHCLVGFHWILGDFRWGKDLPVHYPRHLVVLLSVHSFHLTSCYFVLNSHWGTFAQPATWVLSGVVDSYMIMAAQEQP